MYYQIIDTDSKEIQISVFLVILKQLYRIVI
jgi:hypothetical protein